MKKSLQIILWLALLMTVLCAAASAEGVVINEVLTRNTLYAPVDDVYRGWVEIKNDSESAVDLNGWILSDSIVFKDMFQFKQTVLQPGEMVLVYMGGTDISSYDPVNQSAFRIGKSGGTLTLYRPNAAVADSVEVPGLECDESYARDPETGDWMKTKSVTPAMENTQENYEALMGTDEPAETTVVISEIMASNKTYLTQYGNPDWIELYNTAPSAADLSGWYISDNAEKPEKGLCFPQGTVLEPGEYMLIICDGTSETDETGTLHAGFSLSAEAETVVLADPEGRIASRVDFEGLHRDESYSRLDDGTMTTTMTPSPGYPNTASGAAQAVIQPTASTILSHNETGLYINEVVAATDIAYIDKTSYDWVEIVNTSNNTIDLSGYGLSDKDSRPRKWRFPQGTTIAPGQYLVVMLTGKVNQENDIAKGIFRANFSLSANGCEAVYLSDAKGNVIDSIGLGTQRCNISFGRPANGDAYLYFDTATPGSPNSGMTYTGISANVAFSQEGGAVEGDSITLTLSAEDGTLIYYTTDCTEPTQNSSVYTGPLQISSTTVIRAVAYKSGSLPSNIVSQTYVFGEDTGLRVVSVVGDPAALTGSEGVFARSSKRTDVKINVEVYDYDGTQMVDQMARLRLMGQGSLKQSQKSMRIMAKASYGSGKFKASLFTGRDYTEYDAFVLRSSGQDSWKTRMHDSVLTSLLEGTGVAYQETELCVVYINGVYYGHMNMRERVDENFLCQWHGWNDPDDLDILENKSVLVQGSADDWKSLMEYIKSADMKSDEACAYVAERVDIDNYFTYVAFEMFIANNDLGNTRWYKNPNGDNKWRWIAYDTDLSFQTDQNSLGRWLTSGGVGSVTSQDNTLFVGLMKNAAMKDRFFTILGNLMGTVFTTEEIQSRITARYDKIYTEAIETFELFGEGTETTWNKYVTRIYKYAAERPALFLGYIKEQMGWNDEQMNRYFAAAYAKINGEPAAETAGAEEEVDVQDTPEADETEGN